MITSGEGLGDRSKSAQAQVGDHYYTTIYVIMVIHF